MAIWSMKAAAVNCWRADIWVLDGEGRSSWLGLGRREGLLLWMREESWLRSRVASARALGWRNICSQKVGLEGAWA